MDPGENFAVALMQEVREEAGLDVEIIGVAGATSFEMPEVSVVLLCMEARMKGGEVRLSEEHDAFEWVPLAEMGKRRLAGTTGEFMVEYAKARLARQGLPVRSGKSGRHRTASLNGAPAPPPRPV